MIECTARVGEELAKMQKARGAREAGTERGKRRGCRQQPRQVAEPMTLKELGIERTEAFHAQKIASIPREKLRAHFDQVKESGGEITTACVLRLASQGAPKANPFREGSGRTLRNASTFIRIRSPSGAD